MSLFDSLDNLSLRNPETLKYFALLRTIGKAGLHAQFPNDFEYYMCSFELVDSDENVVDFLIFPILPNSIKEGENNIVNIKKTFGGITTLSTNLFIPKEISLSGNFGKRLKLLIGRGGVDASAIQFKPGKNINPVKSFSNQIKTGYGVTKVLDNILNLSNQLDDKGNPYKLYFYNLAFGTSYLVKYNNKEFKQNFPDSNMIWNYSINMTAVAPLIGLRSQKDQKKALSKLLGKDLLTKGVKKTSNLLKRELRRKDIKI